MPANDNTPDAEQAARQSVSGTCPICGKQRDADYRPFCSRRCADIDLGRWLNGSYAIPVADEEVGEADLADAAALDADKNGNGE